MISAQNNNSSGFLGKLARAWHGLCDWVNWKQDGQYYLVELLEDQLRLGGVEAGQYSTTPGYTRTQAQLVSQFTGNSITAIVINGGGDEDWEREDSAPRYLQLTIRSPQDKVGQVVDIAPADRKLLRQTLLRGLGFSSYTQPKGNPHNSSSLLEMTGV